VVGVASRGRRVEEHGAESDDVVGIGVGDASGAEAGGVVGEVTRESSGLEPGGRGREGQGGEEREEDCLEAKHGGCEGGFVC
jgi:hypothetical protein